MNEKVAWEHNVVKSMPTGRKNTFSQTVCAIRRRETVLELLNRTNQSRNSRQSLMVIIGASLRLRAWQRSSSSRNGRHSRSHSGVSKIM